MASRIVQAGGDTTSKLLKTSGIILKREFALPVALAYHLPQRIQESAIQLTAKTSWLFLITEWLPWLQTNWKDSCYERFALVLNTN